MTKVTSVRLSNNATAQLEHLCLTTKKSKAQLIESALNNYVQTTCGIDDRVTALEYAVETLKDIIARTHSPTTAPEEPELEISEDDCEWIWSDGLQLSQPQRMKVIMALSDFDNPRKILPSDQQAQFDPHAKSYLTYNGHKLTDEALGIFRDGETLKRSQIEKYYE